MARATTKAATMVEICIRIVPSVAPLIEERCFVSVDKNAVNEPVLFSSLSKKTMSCRSIVRKAVFLARLISFSEQKANEMP